MLSGAITFLRARVVFSKPRTKMRSGVLVSSTAPSSQPSALVSFSFSLAPPLPPHRL
jgi:hypothetical protein